MKALVYGGAGATAWEEVPDPVLRDAGDAVVRVDTVTIRGTDLHILRGDVPEVTPGRVLGHEAVGTVGQIDSGVTTVAPGDPVLVSCISACGHCAYCRTGAYGQCLGRGGWVLGHLIDGVQAERVRVPFADFSLLHRLPERLADDHAVLFGDTVLFADILPTSYEVGALNGRVAPGETVVVDVAGPIGLAAVATTRLLIPAHVVVVDPVAARLEAAKALGADVVVDAGEHVADVVRSLTGGLGAHVAIEAVGVPETFELCAALVRPCGRVASVGVHGRPATLHLEDYWIRNLTITTGLVDTRTTPTLLELLRGGRLDVSRLVTHGFALADMLEAYDVLARAGDTGALKVVLSR